MRCVVQASLLGLCLAGCATLPATRNTPYLPPSVFGVYQDNDTGAISQAAWAFASPANTRGNPLAAIRAVVALEYLAGELQENPRWVGMDRSVKVRMVQARDDLRLILGIRTDAPPQFVVNALLNASGAVFAGDQAEAARSLSAPVFTRPPEQTLQVLSNLPYVQTANLATSRAEDQAFPPGGPRS
jgi:hypothetical protein